MTEQKRRSWTPRERAEHALGVAERRVEKSVQKVTATKAAYDEARAAEVAARERLAYVKADPALPQDPAENDE